MSIAYIVRRVASLVQDLAFDLRYSVHTSGEVQIRDLRIDSPNADHAIAYVPTHPLAGRRVFEELPMIDFPRYTFVDFGSGKGRMLFIAAAYPFRKIIGVEFAPELHAIADQNIREYRNPRRKCWDIVSVNIDAAEYEIPVVDTILYFYFPFRRAVMEPILQRLDRSLTAHPRDVFVVYMNPELEFLLAQMANMEMYNRTKYYSVYRSTDRRS